MEGKIHHTCEEFSERPRERSDPRLAPFRPIHCHATGTENTLHKGLNDLFLLELVYTVETWVWINDIVTMAQQTRGKDDDERA